MHARFRFAPLAPESVRERIAHVVQCESLAITAEGVDAVRDLGAGDMRRTLNILQSSFLAKAGAGAVEADDVYATTGQPRPGDIEAIAGMLLNLPFAEAVEQVSATKTARGLALGDICKLLCEYVFRLHMPPAARADLVSDLADVEHRLAYVHGRTPAAPRAGGGVRQSEGGDRPGGRVTRKVRRLTVSRATDRFRLASFVIRRATRRDVWKTTRKLFRVARSTRWCGIHAYIVYLY